MLIFNFTYMKFLYINENEPIVSHIKKNIFNILAKVFPSYMYTLEKGEL